MTADPRRGFWGLDQWRTFVEIIGGDESLQHQLKRQDCVNFLVDTPVPRPPPLFCLHVTYLVSKVLRRRTWTSSAIIDWTIIYKITCWYRKQAERCRINRQSFVVGMCFKENYSDSPSNEYLRHYSAESESEYLRRHNMISKLGEEQKKRSSRP